MPSMTIEEAREILGPQESAELTDEQLKRLIIDLEIIARETLKAIKEGKFKLGEVSKVTGDSN